MYDLKQTRIQLTKRLKVFKFYDNIFKKIYTNESMFFITRVYQEGEISYETIFQKGMEFCTCGNVGA